MSTYFYTEDNIVTDDAAGMMMDRLPPTTDLGLSSPEKRCDSGFQSGSIMPHHHQEYATDRLDPSVRVEYQRLDSGIGSGLCGDFEHLHLSPEHSKLQPGSPAAADKVQPIPNDVSPVHNSTFAEYYEPDNDGDCQLHLAIASGFVEVVFALIRMAPHPSYLDIQNNELYAPLHIAVLMNQAGMVRRLVVAGATIDIRDKEGNTPLHLASKRGYLECAEALLRSISVQELEEASVAVGSSPSHNVIDLKNYHGEHCIHLATFGQHFNFIRLLCWNGADMNATEGRSGKTALHYAVNKRDITLVRLLCSIRGSSALQLNSRDWTGRTPIQCAHLNGDNDIVMFLAQLPGCDTTLLTESDTEDDLDFDDVVSMEGYGDIEVNGVPVVELMA